MIFSTKYNTRLSYSCHARDPNPVILFLDLSKIVQILNLALIDNRMLREVFAVVGCRDTWVSRWLPTFRDISVQYLRAGQSFFDLTDMLLRTAALIPIRAKTSNLVLRRNSVLPHENYAFQWQYTTICSKTFLYRSFWILNVVCIGALEIRVPVGLYLRKTNAGTLPCTSVEYEPTTPVSNRQKAGLRAFHLASTTIEYCTNKFSLPLRLYISQTY